MLCNIKPVPFHESDKHIFAKIQGGGPDPRSPPLDPPMLSERRKEGMGETEGWLSVVKYKHMTPVSVDRATLIV